MEARPGLEKGLVMMSPVEWGCVPLSQLERPACPYTGVRRLSGGGPHHEMEAQLLYARAKEPWFSSVRNRYSTLLKWGRLWGYPYRWYLTATRAPERTSLVFVPPPAPPHRSRAKTPPGRGRAGEFLVALGLRNRPMGKFTCLQNQGPAFSPQHDQENEMTKEQSYKAALGYAAMMLAIGWRASRFEGQEKNTTLLQEIERKITSGEVTLTVNVQRAGDTVRVQAAVLPAGFHDSFSGGACLDLTGPLVLSLEQLERLVNVTPLGTN